MKKKGGRRELGEERRCNSKRMKLISDAIIGLLNFMRRPTPLQKTPESKSWNWSALVMLL